MHCKICKQELSYKGNTTNMLVHLQYNHLQEFNEIKAIDSGVTEHKQASQQPKIYRLSFYPTLILCYVYHLSYLNFEQLILCF